MSGEPSGAITSAKNPLIKETLRLREKRWRDRLGQFLVEGARELTKALGSGARIELLFHCPSLFTDPQAGALVAQAQASGVRVQELGEQAFQRIAYRDRPDGIIAVARVPERTLGDLTLGSPALLLVVEAIEKPGNLGAILRSCDGAGADAVLVCDGVTDIYNPNVVRASLGTLFSRPVVQCASEEAIRWLRERGVSIVATSPDARLNYTDADLRGDVALILGAEDQGLSAGWLAQADQKIVIPMRGDADSLNVAMASTLVLYEALRQRQG